MRKMLTALMLITLMLMGAACAETIELTGEVTKHVKIENVTEDVTIILNNAKLKGGLAVEHDTAAAVTIQLYGSNEIRSNINTGINCYGATKLTIRGAEGSSLLVYGGAGGMGVDGVLKYWAFPVINVPNGDVYIEADDVTLKAFRYQAEGNYTEATYSPAIVAKNLSISGDRVNITGGGLVSQKDETATDEAAGIRCSGTVTITGYEVKILGGSVNGDRAPAIISDAVYVAGSEERPMRVDAGTAVWYQIEGSPFTGRASVGETIGREYAVRTRLGKIAATPSPVPTATPAPTVPATGDSASPLLWLGLTLTAMIAVRRFRRA